MVSFAVKGRGPRREYGRERDAVVTRCLYSNAPKTDFDLRVAKPKRLNPNTYPQKLVKALVGRRKLRTRLVPAKTIESHFSPSTAGRFSLLTPRTRVLLPSSPSPRAPPSCQQHQREYLHPRPPPRILLPRGKRFDKTSVNTKKRTRLKIETRYGTGPYQVTKVKVTRIFTSTINDSLHNELRQVEVEIMNFYYVINSHYIV